MLKTENHSLRKTIFFTIKMIAMFLVVCFAIEYPAQMFGRVLAAEKVYYISEVKVFQAETEAEAQRLCESEGFTCAQKNLNGGTGKDAVFMGYKLTENKNLALYDIKLLQMNDGYDIKDYAEANAELEKSNSGAAETMYASANEFIVNYRDGSPKAIEAYTGLNLFNIPEADNAKLGDYILQGKATKDFFAKVITRASTGAVNAITNFLATGLTPLEKGTDEETGKEVDVTWASKVKDSNVWAVIEDEGTTQDEFDVYDKDMGDTARELHKQLQQFATNLENAQAIFNEKKFVEEAQKTNVDDVVDQTTQTSEDDKSITFVNAYNYLNQYMAVTDGMMLGEYLVDIGKQTSEAVDLRRLYPVIDAMTVAQRKMIGMTGLMSLISTLGENQKNKEAESLIDKAKKKLNELMGADSCSIWYSTNPEMADKKVAFTSDAIRKHAAGQVINSQATNKLAEAKKTFDDVMKWVNIGSSAVTVLTFLAGKYGVAALVGIVKSALSIVTTTTSAIAGKILAISASVSYWSGIVSLVILAITFIFYLITFIIEQIQKNKPKEYTQMADFAVDTKTVNGSSVNINYRAVRDNKDRIADLNAYQAQNGWVCMYVSDQPNAGSPIRADENGNVFNIRYGDANKLSGYDCASYFGQVTPGNCNTGAKKDEVDGIYINYFTENSMANRPQADNTGSTPSGSGSKLYYSDIIVRSGKSAEVVKSKLISKGYQIYDQNLCPNPRKFTILEDEDQFTYIGYQTTNNPDLAIRDIRVATFTHEGNLTFGQISYGCAGTLGFPADTKEDNKALPGDLDGLYITASHDAGTPIEVGKLHLVSGHNMAKPGWEPVTTFSGLPYNFNTARFSDKTDDIPGRKQYAFSYTGYISRDEYVWNNRRTYLYYEPEVQYTGGTKYLSGVFFGFGADSERSVGHYGVTRSKVTELFDSLADIPFAEEASPSKGVNLAQSYFYKGHVPDSNQKYLRMYYTWTYNPYRALTDVQVFRGEPYISRLPYTVSKALSYPAKASGGASASASYAAASVAVQRDWASVWKMRGISPENAYMAPNGLLGENTNVAEGFTREAQGSFKFAGGKMVLLPTNLFVAGYVKDRPRLTLDDVIISNEKHEATNNNGVISCDVSGETTLAGNKAAGSFASVQDLKEPHALTPFNISYPSWTDDGGDPDKTDEKNDSHYHAAGTSVYMYLKHEVVRKRYISRIFVGASERDNLKKESKTPNKEPSKEELEGYDKSVDLNALSGAVAAGSDEVIPFDLGGDPAKAWYNTKVGDDAPNPPKGGDAAAYLSVARTDDPEKAVRSIMLFKSDADAVADQIQIDRAVYYCASSTTPIRMANGHHYFVYYSFNQGTVPGRPITELDVSEAVFVTGSATALTVDKADVTGIDENHKVVVKEKARIYGDDSMKVFIHAKYEAETVYYNKLFVASASTAKLAQLSLLEQGCTEFLDMNLNEGAGGEYVYFGYRGFTLREDKIKQQSTQDAKEREKENQLQEAVYDIVCTVGEEFHPDGFVSERYQLYYAPVGKTVDKKVVATNLNAGTTGPEIYMYYTTTYAANSYNERVQKQEDPVFSSMPKDYLKSPLTKLAVATHDYVPYSVDLSATSSGSEDKTKAWEYVMQSNNKDRVDFNEGAVKFDSDHMTTDNRIAMFAQREDGSVKRSAEITGGYLSSLVTENKLYLNR